MGVVRCAQVEAQNNECPVCCRGGSPRETEMILSAARAPLPSTRPQDHFLGATHRNVVNQKVSLALITRLVSMKWPLVNVVLHVLLQIFWVASADLVGLHNLGSFLWHFSIDYFVYLFFYSLSWLFFAFSLFRLFCFFFQLDLNRTKINIGRSYQWKLISKYVIHPMPTYNY